MGIHACTVCALRTALVPRQSRRDCELSKRHDGWVSRDTHPRTERLKLPRRHFATRRTEVATVPQPVAIHSGETAVAIRSVHNFSGDDANEIQVPRFVQI
jgi:hypothetical protein